MSTLGDVLREGFQNKGLVKPGNLNLWNRPSVPNPKGGDSTVFSMSFGTTGKDGKPVEVLIPKVVGKRILSDKDAVEHYHKTGEHLGMYDSVPSADLAGRRIHRQQELSGPLMDAIGRKEKAEGQRRAARGKR